MSALVQPPLPYLGDNLLLLDELLVACAALGLDEPLLLRASELDKLARIVEQGTDRAGHAGDRRWAHDESIAHVDVVFATTPEDNRRAELDATASSSLRKLPGIAEPLLLVYAAAAFEALGPARQYRFRGPDKRAALRAIFPIRKLALPEGWFSSDEGLCYRGLVREVLRDHDARGQVVEVGCWLGRSTSYVARLCPTLVCVDTWAGSSDRFDAAYRARLATRDVRAEFEAHLDALGVRPRCLQELSTAAAARFAPASLDLVFLDASHDHDAVAADLAAWWPRLRRGGVLAGHDHGARHPELVAALDAWARADEQHEPRHVLRGPGSIWWVRRPT